MILYVIHQFDDVFVACSSVHVLNALACVLMCIH